MVVTKEARMRNRKIGGMSRHTAARLAWSAWVMCVALIALALLLDFVTGDVPVAPQERLGPGLAVLTGGLAVTFPTVGALIASRLPTNPIGWIFCGVGLLYGARRFTTAYADYALLQNWALPWGEYVAWFSTWVGFAGLILIGVYLILLFPDGRLPSRWWRAVAWAAVLGAALTALADAFYPEQLRTHAYVENPFGIVGVIGSWVTTYDLFGASDILGRALLLTSSFAAVLSLVLRLHRARGDERQQLKWFLYAAVPAAVCLIPILLINYCLPANSITNFLFSATDELLWQVYNFSLYVAVFALLILPIFTYIAILRYDLYDIDVVINRTLVYGALTACVVGMYMISVVALGYLFRAQGNLAVSLLATGLVAVMFQPLRDRLQRGVNRLMYGERDDPYAVVSRLGKRLEAAIEPEAVLPTVVETIAQALKLPYAAILLKEGEQYMSAASYGSARGEPE